jgi:2',3'-cyclic-nucleotide 2'-phosphodiesterase (5'-nucleotidase family)
MRLINKKIIFIIIASITFVFSCVPDPLNSNGIGEVIGELKVELSLDEGLTRTQEAPIGDLITDSTMYFLNKGETLPKVDFAIFNSGSIRYDIDIHPNKVIPVGDFTTGIIDEVLVFDNKITLTEVKGSELKEIFEHSVADIENTKGQFLQVSKEVLITVDMSKSPEILNGDIIEQKGNRIISIKINGVEIGDLNLYTIAVPDYIAGGGDNYTTYSLMNSSKKTNLNLSYKDALRDYVDDFIVVEPIVDGRIVFINN